jgi:hypothetical protein
MNKMKKGQKTLIEEVLPDEFLTKEAVTEQFKTLNYFYEQSVTRFTRIFIDAINRKDEEAIYEIGDAIKSLKKVKAAAKPDRNRELILHLKMSLERKGEKWPTRKVADFIGWKQKNLRQVLRMCNELNFPLSDPNVPDK